MSESKEFQSGIKQSRREEDAPKENSEASPSRQEGDLLASFPYNGGPQEEDIRKAEKILKQIQKNVPISAEEVSREGYRNIPLTGRPAHQYYSLFELNEGEEVSRFKGKIVWDLGAGKGGWVKDLKERGITQDAYAMDFLYGVLPESGKYDAYKLPPKEQRVAARLDSLPLKDDSVDDIAALASLPLHADSKKQVSDFFNEIARVLKSGGEARIFPIDNFMDSMGSREESIGFWGRLRGRETKPYILEDNQEQEMKRLGIPTAKKYQDFLIKKYVEAEKWSLECIEELKDNHEIEIHFVSTLLSEKNRNSKTLVIRKK